MKNFQLIAGDMNAQLGRSDFHKFAFHGTSNKNGQMLEDFIQENNLICLTSKFQKHKSKLWTFTYANKTRAQLDHILINTKWKNSALN